MPSAIGTGREWEHFAAVFTEEKILIVEDSCNTLNPHGLASMSKLVDAASETVFLNSHLVSVIV